MHHPLRVILQVSIEVDVDVDSKPMGIDAEFPATHQPHIYIIPV